MLGVSAALDPQTGRAQLDGDEVVLAHDHVNLWQEAEGVASRTAGHQSSTPPAPMVRFAGDRSARADGEHDRLDAVAQLAACRGHRAELAWIRHPRDRPGQRTLTGSPRAPARI